MIFYPNIYVPALTSFYNSSLFLDDCIKSIYWLSDYQTPLKSMSYKETDLRKIYEIKDYATRAQLVEILCKYWFSVALYKY